MSIVHSDYRDVLPTLKQHSVDLIITDPPYGTTRCPWDTPINLAEMWPLFDHVLKPNGACLIFAQTPFDKVLGASNIKNLRYEWIWEKAQATGHFNAKKAPMKAHENILVFYRKLPAYYPQKTNGHKPVNSYTKRAEVVNRTEVYGRVKLDVAGGGATDRYPRSVLRFPSDKQKNKLNGTIHSTQKPLALIEYLIRTYSIEGQLILDPFAGSGTTLLAAQNLGRLYIGVEKEEKFIEVCKGRLNL